jgi:hypothetical protein
MCRINGVEIFPLELAEDTIMNRLLGVVYRNRTLSLWRIYRDPPSDAL